MRQEMNQLGSQISSLKMESTRELEAKQAKVMAGTQELDAQLKKTIAEKADLQRTLMGRIADSEQKLALQTQVRVQSVVRVRRLVEHRIYCARLALIESTEPLIYSTRIYFHAV